MEKNKKLIMIGASGHGKVCAEIAELMGKYSEIIFLDDNPVLTECGKHAVMGPTNRFLDFIDKNTSFFVSIGNLGIRKQIQERIESAGGSVDTLLHPQAIISNTVKIKAGSVVMPGVVINTETEIGKGVIVNTSSSIDHDCVIGDWCHIAVGAHICGNVKISNDCWIGAGVTISNNVSLTSGVVLGAGAVVIKNIDESGVYVDIPAKKIKDRIHE